MAAIENNENNENNWIDLHNFFDKQFSKPRRDLIKKFLEKIEFINYFNTKNVKGDGCCMFYAINELLEEDIFSKEVVIEILNSDKYKEQKDLYLAIEGKELKSELINPNNLSEIFLQISAIEINKNIFVFNSKIDLNQYFITHVNNDFEETIYLLNKDGHYYPLQKKSKDILDNDLLKGIWSSDIEIFQKYLKYKNKYLKLKEKIIN